MIHEVFVIYPITQRESCNNCPGEMSFSAAKRLKTWIRSSMTQTRFNSLADLNIHEERADCLNLVKVCNEFLEQNDIRRRHFLAVLRT